MKTSSVLLVGAQALLASASPLAAAPEKRACSAIHIFGARETTASPGYGSAGAVVNLITAAHSGATSESITYPACGGQASCGSISYANSEKTGVSAVTTAVNSYVASCPNAQIVLVGYSQGGQIFDDALCGGGDANEGITDTSVPLSAAAVAAVKAAIFMGDPRRVNGLPYNVGTCSAGGFAARPSGFSCPSAAKIQSYCDAADPYCCNGNNAATHNGYGSEYGQAALKFVNSKLT